MNLFLSTLSAAGVSMLLKILTDKALSAVLIVLLRALVKRTKNKLDDKVVMALAEALDVAEPVKKPK